jgi:hypothetical protein
VPNHCQRGRAALAIELHLPAGFCGVAGKLGPPVQNAPSTAIVVKLRPASSWRRRDHADGDQRRSEAGNAR